MRAIAVSAAMLVGIVLLSGCSSGPALVDAGQEKSSPQKIHSGAARKLALEHVIDGTIYEMKGEYAKAVLEFQDALRYEQSHGIYFAISKNYSYLRKHSLAIEAGKEAVRLAPENLDYRRNLAETLSRAFQPDAAAEQYREILARDSSARDAWYALARIEQSRRPLQALATYQIILDRFGPDWNVYLQMADLHEGLDSTLTLVHHELKNRVTVVKEYGEIPPVRCHPNQINQVFMNLLVNAAQAIPDKGEIRLKTFREGDMVKVQISDSGVGIPLANLEKIFDPGFTTKGVGVGTGLGLSICFKIAEDHDGGIDVESEVGKGSTFTLRLPVREDESPEETNERG